jgi:NADH-quinone oxidoreductase subunit A
MIWPLLVYFAIVIVMAAAILFVSYLLGQTHSEPATGEPYEGGIVSEGSARVRFSLRYYLVAMFFVVFDLEAVFVYAWAGAVRELGWAGYGAISLFIAVLAASLVYLWRVGALDWSREPHRSRARI